MVGIIDYDFFYDEKIIKNVIVNEDYSILKFNLSKLIK